MTLLGIEIEDSPVQPEKAPNEAQRLPSIVRTLLGISIVDSPVHPEKAPDPILVTGIERSLSLTDEGMNRVEDEPS